VASLINDDLVLVLLAAQPSGQLEVVARLEGGGAQRRPHHLRADQDTRSCPQQEVQNRTIYAL
jgi:hypothetical protein